MQSYNTPFTDFLSAFYVALSNLYQIFPRRKKFIYNSKNKSTKPCFKFKFDHPSKDWNVIYVSNYGDKSLASNLRA